MIGTFFQGGKSDLVEKAYEGIRQMLFYNEIVPGQKIAYREVAEKLKMSPTPVVQALKWLEFQGLVKHETNRGYYTESVSLKEVEEIYDTRCMIELSLIPQVMDNLDDAGLKRLELALQASKSAEEGQYLNKRLLADVEFHLTLASLAQCKTQLQILKRLFDLLYLKYRGTILFIYFEESDVRDHRPMVEAVKSRDREGLQECLQRHIAIVKRNVLLGLERYLEEREENSRLV